MPLYNPITGGSVVDGTIAEADLDASVQASLGLADSAYQKPETGIPAADLAAAAQTSLGLADSATQSADLTAAIEAERTSERAHQSDTYAGLALWPTLTSGAYYYAASPTGSGTSNVLGVGTMRATPLWLPRGAALARIGAEVTSAGDAGSKVRLGIYADNGAGYPGALVVDAGTINGDSNTVQEIIINQTLAAGLYWFAGVVQVVTVTQPTVRTVNAWMPPIQLIAGTSLPGAGGAVHGVSTTGITGALPNPFPAGGGASGLAPRLLFRAT